MTAMSDGSGVIENSVDRDTLLVQREAMTLREKASSVLRKAILDHRFPPGTRLVERELCELLGVSRTSIREALRHLETEKLVVMVPHKGPVVATLDMQDACDLYEVRAALEGLAGEKFAIHASDEDIGSLARVFDEMEAAIEAGDHDLVLKKKKEFYRIIIGGAQNGICREFLESLASRIELFRHTSLSKQGRAAAKLHEVRRIVDAAVARNPDEMKNACIDHVISALTDLKSDWAKEADTGTHA